MTTFKSIGFIYKNCVSKEQKAQYAESTSFQATMHSIYAKEFAQNTELLDTLEAGLKPIVQAGPGQQGFTPTELAARNAQAVNQAAAAQRNIQTAIGQAAAVHSGGAPGVEAGTTKQIRAQAATGVEQELGRQEADITAQNYNIGRQNWMMATEGLMKAPAMLEGATTGVGELALGANKAAMEQANKMAESSRSWMGALGGLAGAGVSALIGGAGSGGGGISGSMSA